MLAIDELAVFIVNFQVFIDFSLFLASWCGKRFQVLPAGVGERGRLSQRQQQKCQRLATLLLGAKCTPHGARGPTCLGTIEFACFWLVCFSTVKNIQIGVEGWVSQTHVHRMTFYRSLSLTGDKPVCWDEDSGNLWITRDPSRLADVELSLDIQTPTEEVLNPLKPPKVPRQEVFGCLGCVGPLAWDSVFVWFLAPASTARRSTMSFASAKKRRKAQEESVICWKIGNKKWQKESAYPLVMFFCDFPSELFRFSTYFLWLHSFFQQGATPGRKHEDISGRLR